MSEKTFEENMAELQKIVDENKDIVEFNQE